MPNVTLDASTITTNTYPAGQCTWWANERYHQLTGVYVPWAADAHGWLAGAQAHGWDWSALPPSGIASIIVLQPGVQGADRTFGHVGAVESINSDGSVVTSDLNWGLTLAEKATTQTITFRLGAGVDFIWDPNAASEALQQTSAGLNSQVFAQLAAGAQAALVPSGDVAATFAALDTALLLVNPFVVTSQNVDLTLFGIDTGVLNPISWVAGALSNIWLDATALTVRLVFLVIGAIIVLKVMSNFIDFDALAQTGMSLGQLAMAAGA